MLELNHLTLVLSFSIHRSTAALLLMIDRKGGTGAEGRQRYKNKNYMAYVRQMVGPITNSH